MPAPVSHVRKANRDSEDAAFFASVGSTLPTTTVANNFDGGGNRNRANSSGSGVQGGIRLSASRDSDDDDDDVGDDDDVSYYGQNDDEGEEVHRHGQAAAKSPPSTAAGGTDPRFDLCGSMWKRRGGLGRNAERNWVLRCFTLKGPSLCYHEESEFDSIANHRKPRASLDLSRLETIAEMHSKQKPGLPSQDLLTINIYDPIVHAKRKKWEMACTSKEQQLLWYRAIKAYDGKPTHVPYLPLSPADGGGGDREGLVSLPAAAGTTPRPRMPDLSNDDVDLIARAAARASEILIDKQRQFEQHQQSAVALSGSTLAAMAAIVNLVIYTARNGSEGTFTMIVYAVNAIIIYVAYGRMTSPIGASSRSAGNPRARAAAGKSAKRTTGAEADERQCPPPASQQPSFARTIPAGRTIPRAAAARGGDLDGRLRSCPPDSAAAVRAYASSAPSEVDVAPHTYGNADPECFHLRVGPNYRKNRTKAPSGPALYDLLSVDFLYADAPLRNASDKFRIPRIPGITDVNTGHDHIPPMLIVNTWLPGEEPSMFAKGGADGGDTYCIPMIFVLSSSTLEQLRDIDTASPGVRLLSEWCRRGDNDPDFRGRFKCMGMIEDIESTGWVVLLITFGSNDIVFAMVQFISYPFSLFRIFILACRNSSRGTTVNPPL